MITLGITGGIGAGKSVVCRILEALGIPVYDTDREAKSLYDRDPLLKEQMIALLGCQLYETPDGSIDRQQLARLIFSSSSLLAKVEGIVHPAVRQDILRWKNAIAHEEESDICAVESALLLSSDPLRAIVDQSVLVVAPDELRISRAMRRDNALLDAVLARMSKQLSQEEMMSRANFHIHNDGAVPLLPQIDQLLRELRKSVV